MTINEFTNSEILFLYFANQDLIEGIDDIIEHGSTYQEINLAGISTISVETPVSEEELIELRSSVIYTNALAVNEKLRPIVLMIEEADSELYNLFVSLRNPLKK
jgi:hypothetical protein